MDSSSPPAIFLILLTLFWIYWAVALFIATPVFYFTKTSRAQAPIHRRFVSMGYGLIWPYMLVKAVTGPPNGNRGPDDGPSSAKARSILDD